MKTSRVCLIVLAVVCGALTAACWGFINPKFTVRDLLAQSDEALVLEIKSVDAESGAAVATVRRVLKADPNRPAPKEIKIDFLAMGPQLSAQGKLIIGLVQGGDKQAVMFRGKFDPGGTDDSKLEEEGTRVFLNIGGKWLILDLDEKSGVWEMQKMWEFLLGTWAGGTDQLLRCLDYLQADPEADAPIVEGVDWEANSIGRVGKVRGKVSAAMPVDLAGKGPPDLFVASDAGDRLFRWNGRKMEDVTAKVGLTSKSRVAAWGSFDGDGKLALASWDGKALSIHSQRAEGGFAARACGVGDWVNGGCLSLWAIDIGSRGKAGLLVGTRGWPVLLVPRGNGSFHIDPLGRGDMPGMVGASGPCLAADFNGDGLVDVLQIGSEGSLFYKALVPGAFGEPERTAIAAGPGRYGACVGDFDGDGNQDVFLAGWDHNGLWANLGDGNFADTLYFGGELGYISKNGGTVACAGDINNDGRQDIMIAYGGNKMPPQLFFNRGFRCFGLCRDYMDIAQHKAALEQLDKDLVTDLSEPQQAACLGDFNGDGALDMAVVMGNGDVVLFPRNVESPDNWDPGNKNLGAVVSLSPSTPSAGPLNVQAYEGKWHLGSWLVRQGDGGTIIGAKRPGTITLKWTWPGGKAQEKQVKVKDGPVRVTLGEN